MAGPLLAVFLLGMFTRRTTAASALTTLLAGAVFTSWLVAANQLARRSACLWPLAAEAQRRLASHLRRRLLLGLGLPVRVSCWASAEPATELRGLVVGLGALGRT